MGCTRQTSMAEVADDAFLTALATDMGKPTSYWQEVSCLAGV